MKERPYTTPEIDERAFTEPELLERETRQELMLGSCDEFSDLMEDEDLKKVFEKWEKEAEGRFLQPEETAFAISEDGSILTPFHSSITNLMKIFGYKYDDASREGEVVIERYTPFRNGERYYAHVFYCVKMCTYTMAERGTNMVTKTDRVSFIVEPTITFADKDDRIDNPPNHSIDITPLIRNYTLNNFRGAMAKLWKEITRTRSNPLSYIA